MSSQFDDVRVIIDGLDECGASVDAAVLGIQELVTGGLDSISLAIFSRDEYIIRDSFNPLGCAHIDIAAVGKDIDLFVRAEMDRLINLRRLRIKDLDLKEEIVEKLVSKAEGMYVDPFPLM